jgi:hypothetical protein
MYNSAAGRAAIGKVAHDFYRCRRCQRLITQPELVRALGPSGVGSACPCGGTTYSPANLTMRSWILPRVWVFAIARLWELGLSGVWANLKDDWRRRTRPPVEEPREPSMRAIE